MLKYTTAAYQRISKDLKTISIIFNVFVLIAYLGYLMYAITSGSGNLYINIFLACISLGYLIFYIIEQFAQISKNEKDAAKHLYTIFKLLANALSLLIAIYGIATNVSDKNDVIITVALGALWVIQLLVECIVLWIEDRIALFYAAICKDGAVVVKVINRFREDDIDIPDSNSPEIKRLQKAVDRNKIQAKEKKANKKKQKLSNVKSKAKQLLHIK